ncbi:hypothetical protein RA265_30165, partial [Pseudomonas syringae pv. tagetis]
RDYFYLFMLCVCGSVIDDEVVIGIGAFLVLNNQRREVAGWSVCGVGGVVGGGFLCRGWFSGGGVPVGFVQ